VVWEVGGGDPSSYPIRISTETVEKPRGFLSVKKAAFENALGAMFSNRAL